MVRNQVLGKWVAIKTEIESIYTKNHILYLEDKLPTLSLEGRST